MIRRPPSVSSTWLIVSLQSACALMLCAFSLRPTQPMNQPMMGTMMRVKRVSSQEMKIKAAK